MREITVKHASNPFLLVEKANLPQKGRYFRIRVPRNFDAVVMTSDRSTALLGEGRKDIFLNKQIESIYFVRTYIEEQLLWKSTSGSEHSRHNAGSVSGYLLVSVFNARKLIKSLRGSSVSDARSVLKLLRERIESAIKTHLSDSLHKDFPLNDAKRKVAIDVNRALDEYGLYLEHFVLNP